MSFICKNIDCSAPENKKGKVYPSDMECPFCDAPLVEVLSFNEADLKLINSLPYVIAYPLKRAITEKHAWTRINLLKDTFLNYLKYLGLITATEFFKSDLKDKKMVALFHASLAEPSFGTWNLYIRETIAYLNQNNHSFFCPELPGYYETIETGKKRKLYKGEIEFIDSNGDVQLKKQEATAIGMLINFRNRYLGHGLTLDEDASKKLWDEYYPIFNQLLIQLNFPIEYPMFKHEHGETYLLQSNELSAIEKGNQSSASVWIENPSGQTMDILPFFIVPGELALTKEDKEQLLTYESYTGKTIKFFSPEGTEKQTSGKILEKLNLLLRDKQKEQPYTPESFTKEVFLQRIADENKLTLDTLIAEKKYIPGVYVHREEMEIKLREWIGARANIFFIAAEAGSGKTNLLIEMQQQYAAQNLPVIFIRAARMDKPSLQAQIAHLLNIQPELGIEDYTSISGTQASPTFILIDGLNEAVQGESLWQEILEISKKSTPGSLKFVVSSRANTSADLNRYPLVDVDEVYLYGEKKEGHTELSAFAFWLTALNMSEMKSAWEAYGQMNKNKYKPQFSFDDIATFDRGIYNLISNPLVLRIFLETYHNKPLPKKGNKHLNIWQDWLSTFSDEEIAFLKNLAQAVWEKGENELLLDDLLNNPKLNSFLTTDLINAPYPRLKNLGWISRYVKGFNACIAFTVEGSLLHLLGNKIENQDPPIQLSEIKLLLKTGSKFQKDGVGNYLQQQALRGNLKRVCELIDSGDEFVDTCIIPLTYHLKAIGVKETLGILLLNPTENDWQALLKVDLALEELTLHTLRKDLAVNLLPLNDFSSTVSLQLGLRQLLLIDKDESFLSKLQINLVTISHDVQINRDLARVYLKFGDYDAAMKFFQQDLDICITTFGKQHQEVAFSYTNIGQVWFSKGDYDKALEFFQLSLDIGMNTLVNKSYLASIYNNFGLVWTKKGEFDKALDFLNQGLVIGVKTFGNQHPFIGAIYNNIGIALKNKFDFDKALEFYQQSLEIQLKIFGNQHDSLVNIYNNIGSLSLDKEDFDMALKFFEQGSEISTKSLGIHHPSTAYSYIHIGNAWVKKGDSDKALEFLQKGLDIFLKTLGGMHPEVATTYNNIGYILIQKGDLDNALEFLQEGLDISIKTIGDQHPNIANMYSNLASVWEKKGIYDKSIEYYERVIKIELKLLPTEFLSFDFISFMGTELQNNGEFLKAIALYKGCLEMQSKAQSKTDSETATVFFNIGKCYKALNLYREAIQNFVSGFEMSTTGGFPFQIALCYEGLSEDEAAFEYYLQSAEIRRNDPDIGGEAESTKQSITAAKRLAVELGKEDELPEWIQEIQL